MNEVYAALFEYYRDDPVFFVEHALGLLTWSKMRDIMESVKDNKRTAVRASHGVSKTFTAALIATWFFNCYPHSKVITTAPTYKQVRNLLWAEIARCYRNSRIKLDGECFTTEIRTEEPEHYALGFSTDKAMSAEGFHAPQILFIFDEAKGVDQWMWNAVKGAMTSGMSRLLAISTTDGVQVGEQFYACFHDDINNQWNKIHIDCHDSPYFTGEPFEGIQWNDNNPVSFTQQFVRPPEVADTIQIASPEWESDCIDDWGNTSVLYLTKCRGEIVNDGADTVIKLDQVAAMFNNYEDTDFDDTGQKEAGVDVARSGDDNTVVYVRKGLKVIKRKVITKFAHDKAILVLQANEIEEVLEYDKSITVKVDDTGVGGGLSDILISRGYKVVKVNFEQSAHDADKYPNAISEMWYEVGALIKEIACPRIDRLQRELTNRKRKNLDKRGRRCIESKKEYKARGFTSPDDADAFLLCFYTVKTPDFSAVSVDWI